MPLTRPILQTEEFLTRYMTIKSRTKVRIIPGFGINLGITVTMLSVLILIPLASVMLISFSLSPGVMIESITEKKVVAALLTSVGCAFIAALINSVFGLLLAWVLVRFDFRGKRIIDGLIELP